MRQNQLNCEWQMQRKLYNIHNATLGLTFYIFKIVYTYYMIVFISVAEVTARQGKQQPNARQAGW